MYEFLKMLVLDRDKRLVLLSAVLFSAGFAPLSFGFLAWFCLVPLLVVARDKGFKSGFRLGYLFGFEITVFTLHWVASFAFNSSQGVTIIHPLLTKTVYGLFCFVGMAVLHSLFYAMIFGAFCWLYRRHRVFIMFLPFVWTSVEYIRTLSQFAFPWAFLCYTQSSYLPLIQTADIWGDLGISFWLCVVNLLIYAAWSQRRKIVIASSIAIAGLFAGALLYDPDLTESDDDISVALLQGHFPLEIKWDRALRDYNIHIYDSLTREADSNGVDLIIWPETAAPMYLELEHMYYHRLATLASDLETYMLVGTLIYDQGRAGERGEYYNGCYQFTPNGQVQIPYKKIELVPFSERVPYADYFPLVKKIDLGQSDFSSGDTLLLFRHPKGDYACLICFELAFADLARSYVNRGADFLVTITNDTWFGKTAGPYQHMQMTPFRAIENRVWIARCANSGFTFTTDPYGKKHGRSDLWERTIVYERIGRVSELTFFTKHGYWLPKLCVLITFLFLLVGVVVKLFSV